MKLPLIDMKMTGETLRQHRERQNMTVADVSELLGITQQAIYKWESGKTLPTIDNAVMLACIYKCKLDDLIATCI